MVPGEEVEAQAEQAGGGGLDGVEEVSELWAGFVGHVVGLAGGLAGEAAKVAVGLGIDSQGPSDGVDDLRTPPRAEPNRPARRSRPAPPPLPDGWGAGFLASG